MKKRRWIISLIISLIVIIIIGIVSFNIINDKNKLTSEERTWISNNVNNVQNIYVVKDENVFSKDGSGVFYTFLNSLEEEYDLKINIISIDGDTTGNTLTVSKTMNENDKEFYRDHYVVVSKEMTLINSNKDLDSKTVGVLNSELGFVKTYLKDVNVTFNGYEKVEDLFSSLGKDIQYIIIPRMKYINQILSNNLVIVYHLNDINNHYILKASDDILGSILTKHFNKWYNKINEEIKNEEFKIFTKSLEISDTEVDKLLSIDYNYGFVPLSPYEINNGRDFAGIVASFIDEFSLFSKVNFNISKYNDNIKLVKEVNKGNVDMFFGYDNTIKSEFLKTTNGINVSISLISNKNSNKIFDSVYGLINETVHVKSNSKIYNYLKSIGNINLITYENDKELFKLNKEDAIIAIDSYIFDYYKDNKLNNYVLRYETNTSGIYDFKIKNEHTILQKLFDKYINYLDSRTIITNGINDHNNAIKNGNLLTKIARYILLLVIGLIVVWFIVYKKSKRIRVSKKIRKDDKIKFIDDLTMLKNRAYLSDFIKTWNNNTIYPQAIIVVGLKNLQEINEKYGVDEGDKQIQAASNALIKTQLDNSDLMRSDGNEFVIYSVGYNQKQIINYLHKLTREFKKLPYDYGAEYGYRIIENDLTTIEDALTDATLDMKNKKERNK